MLILTRKQDESIIIDDNIEITVISIDEGKVKLGISAPKEIAIHRKEIYLDIQNENKKAAESSIKLDELKKLFKKWILSKMFVYKFLLVFTTNG